eukprot:4984450-Prymnesium_polylepis.1
MMTPTPHRTSTYSRRLVPTPSSLTPSPPTRNLPTADDENSGSTPQRWHRSDGPRHSRSPHTIAEPVDWPGRAVDWPGEDAAPLSAAGRSRVHSAEVLSRLEPAACESRRRA